jgi:poly-gamma-glutamate capsule biosynthesis protein CapA/YwtB (metallophosphatase superfamily)
MRFIALPLVLVLSVTVDSQTPAPVNQPPARDPAREVATSVADGFTLAAVGDLIIARPISQNRDPGFTAVAAILRDADATFGNFEGSAFDIRQFKGHPQAEFGGVWIIGIPEVAKDLRSLGFDLVSRANNHATDWGVEGMRLTSDALNEAGIVHAGVGEHRAAARAGRSIDTPKGRIGLVSMASTFTPLSRSTPPVGEAPGRPGVNALRTTRYSLITREEMQVLRKIRDEQPPGSIRLPEVDNPDELTLFGANYRVGDRRGFTFRMDPVDRDEILKSIRATKQMTDFVVATIHAHEPGNWSEEPADFLPELARATIDAGADQFVGHGPHQLRGIEIYKGKPIFYSLGDFVFQLDLLEPVGMDLYEQFKMDPTKATDADFNAMWNARTFTGEHWYQSVIAVSRFDQGRVSEIRLHPVDLNYAARGANRGVPRAAAPAVARRILEQLQRLSKPYGTTISIEQNVGVIRVPRATTSEARDKRDD